MSMKLINLMKHDICRGRSAVMDLTLSLVWSLRTWNTCCVQHSLCYLTSIAWASHGYITLLNLVITAGSWEVSTACLSAFSKFLVLTVKRAWQVIWLTEEALVFWQRLCQRSCEWHWCSWCICFHFWAWSFIATFLYGIPSWGHWMFKVVSGLL